jgi:hypothetical protein
MSDSSCGQHLIKVTSGAGMRLPNFIKFNQGVISVNNPLPSSEGVYSLKATLQASEYDPSSSLSTEFHINVICKPSTIASSVAELSYTYTMSLN